MCCGVIYSNVASPSGLPDQHNLVDNEFWVGSLLLICILDKESLIGSYCCIQGSLACLKTRGYMVSFGQSSGAPDPVPLSAIAVKSLFLTRPRLFNYAVTRDELLGMAGEVFGNVQSGVLRVRVNHTYPLSQAAQAHEDLENRKTSGSVVLIP